MPNTILCHQLLRRIYQTRYGAVSSILRKTNDLGQQLLRA